MDVSHIKKAMVSRVLAYRNNIVDQNVNFDELIVDDDLYVDYKGWLGEFLDELIHNWCNPEYSSEKARSLIENDEMIANASLEDVVGAITFMVRRDRFSAGSFGYDVERGTMLKVLNRLEIIGRDL